MDALFTVTRQLSAFKILTFVLPLLCPPQRHPFAFSAPLPPLPPLPTLLCALFASFYSFEVGPVHVIVLNPYTSSGDRSVQYYWLKKVRRSL